MLKDVIANFVPWKNGLYVVDRTAWNRIELKWPIQGFMALFVT